MLHWDDWHGPTGRYRREVRNATGAGSGGPFAGIWWRVIGYTLLWEALAVAVALGIARLLGWMG